jgi:hypothetical protein
VQGNGIGIAFSLDRGRESGDYKNHRSEAKMRKDTDSLEKVLAQNEDYRTAKADEARLREVINWNVLGKDRDRLYRRVDDERIDAANDILFLSRIIDDVVDDLEKSEEENDKLLSIVYRQSKVMDIMMDAIREKDKQIKELIEELELSHR